MKKDDIKITVDRGTFGIGNRISASFTATYATEIDFSLFNRSGANVEEALRIIVRNNADDIVHKFLGDTHILRAIEAKLYSIGDFDLAYGLKAYIDSLYISKNDLDEIIATKVIPMIKDEWGYNMLNDKK